MDVKIVPLESKDLNQFIIDIQTSFQKGFETVFGKTNEIVIPVKDIMESINKTGAFCYKAVLNDEMIGGAVVVINEETNYNYLDLLYVKDGFQSNGIGILIWNELEKLYPNTTIWETCTPCFDKRNVHFYVNKCGFHIVEFQREINDEGFIGDGGEGMFVFKKWM